MRGTMSSGGKAPLTLIGTVHRDRDGERRLAALLEALQPQIMTLEMSEVSLRSRQLHTTSRLQRLTHILAQLAAESGTTVAALNSLPAVIGIRTLIDYPFEYRAAAAYAARHSIPLELIDAPEVARDKLRRIDRELLTRRNLRVLTTIKEQGPDGHQEGYGLARRILSGSAPAALRQAFLAGRRGEEGVGPRDRRMAVAIRQQIARHPGGHLVHIGGWVHLVEDESGETLFSLLSDLAPRRRLLDSTLTPD